MPMDDFSSMCVDCMPDDEIIEIGNINNYSLCEKTMDLQFID